MIALDTNVLVRIFTEDDPEQTRVAQRFMDGLTEDRPGFICREVVLELVWVLERTYRIKRERIAEAVKGLLRSRELVVETADDLALAIADWQEGGAGLSDRMVVAAARRAGAGPVMTFARKAARIPGMELLG